MQGLDESNFAQDHGLMKELQHVGGTVVLDDKVADALAQFASALAESEMSAIVSLRPNGRPAAIEVQIGRNEANGTNHILHAKTASSEGSHLDIDEI